MATPTDWQIVDAILFLYATALPTGIYLAELHEIVMQLPEMRICFQLRHGVRQDGLPHAVANMIPA